MQVKAEKITDLSLCREVCEATMQNKTSKVSLKQIYKSEHSPIRSQMFKITMKDIPTFVSVHFVRHSIGIQHYVMSNRNDITGSNEVVTRESPVNHTMLLNAESLINLSKKRLCTKASLETRKVMKLIKDAIKEVDSDLSEFMVPQCVYRAGICQELKSCKYNKSYNFIIELQNYLANFN